MRILKCTKSLSVLGLFIATSAFANVTGKVVNSLDDPLLGVEVKYLEKNISNNIIFKTYNKVTQLSSIIVCVYLWLNVCD